jgi:hypothetical protein
MAKFWVAVGLLAIGAAAASGNSPRSATAAASYNAYLPFVQAAQQVCDPGAVAQLRSAATWQGEFSIAFSGNASGPWPGGASEVVSVNRSMQFQNLTLTKTFDSATFVRWTIAQQIDTGQFMANDSDEYTNNLGGVSTLTAQFSGNATADVLRIILYPDQCKLRFELDGQAIGPVVGDRYPNNYFYFCATLDVLAPRAGAQRFGSGVPIYRRSSSASAYETARLAGVACRVGGGDPNISDELFTPKLAWVLDGGTTSGMRGKGAVPLGSAQVTYSFAPQP